MSQYLFAATDRMGNAIRGAVEAADMSDAVNQIARMGYTLLQVQAADAPQASTTQAPVAGPPSATTSVSPPPTQPPSPTQTQILPGMAPAQQIPARPQPVSPEPTQTMPPVASGATQDILQADMAKRRKVEADLVRMGMTPDEIRRLLNASATTSNDVAKTPVPIATSLPVSAPAASARSKRVTAASLESFAAELTSANAAKNVQSVENVRLNLPDFRESTMDEVRKSEALLREASMLRRRERYREAEAKCREALTLTPKDAAALELLGDLLQGVGRVDEALAAYQRATQADSTRVSAEKKYGDLLMRQQNWNFADPEATVPNRWFNSIVSLLLPGTGQAWNGEWGKALMFFALDLLCIYLLFWSPWAVTHPKKHDITLTLGSFILLFVIDIAALVDSNLVAARKRAG